MQKSIMITGGCGYIGSMLTKKIALERSYEEVHVVDLQWFGNNLETVKDLAPHLWVEQQDIRDIKKIRPGTETVIHLASVANDPCVELDPKLSWEINVLGTQNLLDKAVKAGVRQFIYASSGSVYGVSETERVTEDIDLVPISEYNKTKMVAERVVMSYKDDIAVTCLRPATVCGWSFRQRLDVVVNMLTMQALQNNSIRVLGGSQMRPHLHIDDMIRAYEFCLDNPPRVAGQIFNVGFQNISVLALAEFIKRRIGDTIEIVVEDSDDPRSYRMDSSKIQEAGFYPRNGIEDAIDQLVFNFEMNRLNDEKICYNIRWMKEIFNKEN